MSASCTGFGFTVGPPFTGLVVTGHEPQTGYQPIITAVLVGAVIAWKSLADARLRLWAACDQSVGSTLNRPKPSVEERRLRVTNSARSLLGLTLFSAICVSLPLNSAPLLGREAIVGSMSAVQWSVSTTGQLLSGLLPGKFPGTNLTIMALALAVLPAAVISLASALAWLGILVVGNGVSDGVPHSQSCLHNKASPGAERATWFVYTVRHATSRTPLPLLLSASLPSVGSWRSLLELPVPVSWSVWGALYMRLWRARVPILLVEGEEVSGCAVPDHMFPEHHGWRLSGLSTSDLPIRGHLEWGCVAGSF